MYSNPRAIESIEISDSTNLECLGDNHIHKMNAIIWTKKQIRDEICSSKRNKKKTRKMSFIWEIRIVKEKIEVIISFLLYFEFLSLFTHMRVYLIFFLFLCDSRTKKMFCRQVSIFSISGRKSILFVFKRADIKYHWSISSPYIHNPPLDKNWKKKHCQKQRKIIKFNVIYLI